MRQKKLTNYFNVLIAAALLVFIGCGKDDEVVVQDQEPPQNQAPVIEAQAFSVREDVDEETIIGEVRASDPDEDELTFSITENSDELFEITTDGKLSLVNSATLDFEATESHTVTVAVSDGEENASATVTISVTDVDEAVTPTIDAQTFMVSENASDIEVIGTVTAKDPNGDALTFSISEDTEGLFEMTESGSLSLLAGKSLDFETAESHALMVAVSDGALSASATITIKVIDGNDAPTAAAQSFTVTEIISDTEEIGTVVATDPNSDELTYSITEDADDLFEITESGVLTLLEGAKLDFETTENHTLTVSATDGTETVSFPITIDVTNAADEPFVTTWETTIANESIQIQAFSAAFDYNYTVDWGDGNVSAGERGFVTHTYADAGVYTVSITGTFPHIRNGNNATNAAKLKSIESWGEIAWESMERSFEDCANMEYNATDVPDLRQVTTMAEMFTDAAEFDGDLSNWDVSNVRNMANMFLRANAFNGDISNWAVGNVVNMSGMFLEARAFNRDLNWDVSNVTDMRRMFSRATSFNGNISGWDVSSVVRMDNMFSGASSFNRDLNEWVVGNVTNMGSMFSGASAFNGNISTWDVSKVTDMNNMFTSASSFNSDIRGWIVSNVEDMSAMFTRATSFNANISAWDVSNVTDMGSMFLFTSSFDQDLSGWSVDNVTQCSGFNFGSLEDSKRPNFTNCNPDAV